MTSPAAFCRKCGRAEVIGHGRCGWCGDEGGQKPIRAFHVTHEAYYFQPHGLHSRWKEQGIEGEVGLGLYTEGGGTLGEMFVRWHRLGNNEFATPRLEVYCDAWIVLDRMADVVRTLAMRDSTRTRHNMTPVEFRQVLLDLGFTDQTPRVDPYTRPE